MISRLVSLILAAAGLASAAPIDLRLPTENHHLFTGEMDRFYMYVDRDFEGQRTQPWEAGSFGFVRTAIRVNGEVLLTKFHEGIDISPVRRDKAGNPLDLVSAIAQGRVVHISPQAGRSNYGKYVVVEHMWENSAVYSLYAHLAEITCKPGDDVNAGSVLGRMGYTGAGINRVRAHCHLEVAMMTSSRYEDWHRQFGGGTNFHGLFNGMNLIGTEVARFFLEQKANPELQFSQFVASTPVYFKVTVPAHGGAAPDFAKRYPWMVKGDTTGATSWEISFSATGQPVAFAPGKREVTTAVVTSIRPTTVPHRYLTRGLITGEGAKATLTNSGKQLVALITDDFPTLPAPAPKTTTPHPHSP